MLSYYLVGDLTGRLGVMGQVDYGVARSIAEAVFAGLGLSVVAFAIVWVVSRKWPPDRPAVSQNQPLQGEALPDEDTGMNTSTPMSEAEKLLREFKESAARDAARALEGFEKRAERIEEGRPARSQFKRPESAQPKATTEAETENPRSLQEVLDQAKQREEHRYRETGRARVEDDDDEGVMVVHRDDIPKIEAMTRLINEGFDRELQRTIKEAEAQEGHEPDGLSSTAGSKQDHLADYGEEMLRFIRGARSGGAEQAQKLSRSDKLFKAAFVPGPTRWMGSSPPSYPSESQELKTVLINLGRHAKRVKSAAPKFVGLKNVLWLNMVAYFLVFVSAVSMESDFTVVFLLLFVLSIIATVLAYAGASAASRIGEVPRVLRDELLFTRRDIKRAASTLNDAELVRALGEREVFLQATILEYMMGRK